MDVLDAVHKRDQALIFTADRIGVCPRLLISKWAGYVMQARNWFENGQLGTNYIDAPAWVATAFSLLSSEITKAYKVKGELDRA